MSAKRLTTALVSGTWSAPAIACARAGLELPATSLMEPFFADIDVPPRALLDTMFSISGFPRNRLPSTCEEISGGYRRWQPVGSGFPSEMPYWARLAAGVPKGADIKCPRWGRLGIRDRRTALRRCGRLRRLFLRRPVNHAAQAA